MMPFFPDYWSTSRKIGVSTLVLIIVAGTLWIGLSGGDDGDEQPSSSGATTTATREAPPAAPHVTYRVTARVPIDLTYTNAQGNTEQRANESVPWSLSFDANRDDHLYVSAQNGDSNTEVKCEIEVDGEVIEEATSNGAFTIATCSGSVP